MILRYMPTEPLVVPPEKYENEYAWLIFSREGSKREKDVLIGLSSRVPGWLTELPVCAMAVPARAATIPTKQQAINFFISIISLAGLPPILLEAVPLC
jgi:hypothetical protein